MADVSVIIPHFNASSTVERSIASVANQSVKFAELLIIDDCSDDFHALSLIVSKWQDHLPIRLIRLPVNAGASEARNHGASIATGKYLAFLDSDDVWRSDKIEIQYALMERDQLHLSGHLYVTDLNSMTMGGETQVQCKSVSAVKFAFGNPFFTPTIMVRRAGFTEFDVRYRRVDDYKCWLMNVRNGSNGLIMLPLAGGYKRAIGESGLTSSLPLMHQAYVTVLNDLFREGHVNAVFFFTARLIEQLKYPLRVVRHHLARKA